MNFLGKKIRNRYLLMGDIFLSAVSVLASYMIRLELVAIFPTYQVSLLWMLGIAIVIKPLVYYFFGIYRRLWRYASIRELVLILASVSTASMIVGSAMMGLYGTRFFIGFPRSVIIIDWLLTLIFIGGFRFIFRWIAESSSAAANNSLLHSLHRKWVLVVGAGDAGAMVVRELLKNPQLNMKPIGFLDDDPEKQNSKIHGVPVLAPIDDIERVFKTRHVDEVIIAIPSASGEVLRKITTKCRQRNIPFRTMPGLYELIGGSVSVSRLREVDISDLLRREPVKMDIEALGKVLEDKVIMVTGAGGSIGSELCRQIARLHPKRILLLGHGENSIFSVITSLKERYPHLDLVPLIADVRDFPRLTILFDRWQPQVVFHTAAHKHVPLMESNIEEAVTNNILGTDNIVISSLEHEVQRLVMISTDKAIRPVNIMGATKRIAEMLVLDAAHQFERAFTVVRFGNVLGSRGSVVPRFKRQIEAGGPVTVTHPEMKRYFMTIPEAVHLVLQASTLSKGGENYILDMGQPVKILDLAEDLIRLSGLEPGKDIEIVFSGIRPGEKLNEDLWDKGFAYSPTTHPDIHQVDTEEVLSSEELRDLVDTLIGYAREGKPEKIRALLSDIIPGASILQQETDLDMVE
ncbi:MAG: Putative polysaccharide biosynthesis protein [Anaerolineaceae bacterium 46_22]|nr:MAG: Putative polysaccharide biosynthesis protein [Anaerolineaceae bacterium 46_22]